MANKINFTKEHQAKLANMALTALFNNITFNTSMGGTCGISELLHQTTVNSLLQMKQNLDKKIASREAADEWTMTDTEQKNLTELKSKSELINLIIGWKKFVAYQNEIAKEKEELDKKIADLKESTKTPEDKIKELEAQRAALDE